MFGRVVFRRCGPRLVSRHHRFCILESRTTRPYFQSSIRYYSAKQEPDNERANTNQDQTQEQTNQTQENTNKQEEQKDANEETNKDETNKEESAEQAQESSAYGNFFDNDTQQKKQVHPYALESGTVFYEGPFAFATKTLKLLANAVLPITTAGSQLIAYFGDETLPPFVLMSSAAFVFYTGALSYVYVQKLTWPYVVRFKVIKDDTAKTKDDIPEKFVKEQEGDKEKENTDETPEEEKENLSEDQNNEEEKIEEGEDGEEEEEKAEIYDLSGYSLELTKLDWIGTEVTKTIDINGIRPVLTKHGLVNLRTECGEDLYIHEDHISFEGHDWFLQHIQNQKELDTTEKSEKPAEEWDPESLF